MSSKITEKRALTYLGYHHELPDVRIQALLDEVALEVETNAHFCAVMHYYDIDVAAFKALGIDLNNPDLLKHLAGSSQVALIGATLGIQIDKMTRYYEQIDVTKMSIFDAYAGSYLETCCDNYLDESMKQEHTFIYCPGYGSVDLKMNAIIVRLLDADKLIGLTCKSGGSLAPQKSIVGLIGVGKKGITKNCNHCRLINECIYRKAGTRCYGK